MSAGDVVVVIPSRGRPAKAAEAVACVGVTSTTDPWVFVVVDDDDPTLPQYRELIGGSSTTVVLCPGGGHVPAINWGARFALASPLPLSAIIKLDDDHRPRTHGWDARYRDALADMGGGIVYGNDGFQGAHLPTAPGISAGVVRALGWFAPPTIQHLYCDNAWKDIGEGLGRLRFLPDVVVEHMHPHAGKAEMDEGYRRVNSDEQYDRDAAAYRCWRFNDKRTDLARVRAAMGWT